MLNVIDTAKSLQLSVKFDVRRMLKSPVVLKWIKRQDFISSVLNGRKMTLFKRRVCVACSLSVLGDGPQNM